MPIESSESADYRRLNIEQALRRSEERFRRVVEYAPNAMVMVNQAGLIEMANAQTERVFGYTREELLGQPVNMLVPERFRRQHVGMKRSFFADPKSRPMGAGRDLFALRKDAREFPVEIGLNPIETSEGTMVLAAIVDISDRKQKEESIQQALKEKDVLLGEVHHRVKNNLQIVHSLLDLQSARVADPVALEMLRDSQSRVRSLALIHQTLYQSHDFARVDFGRFLDSLLPTLVSSYGADPERIVLTVNASDVFLPIGVAIPCGLVVNELISNALKHAFPKRRTGEIIVDLRRDPENQALLAVSDNGAGLPPGIDARQASTLGLQLVSLLADQLGGALEIRHANPTRFAIKFPVPD